MRLASKGVSISVPEHWHLTDVKKADPGDDRASYTVLTFLATLPDLEVPVQFELVVINSGAFRILPDVLREQTFFSSFDCSGPCPSTMCRPSEQFFGHCSR